MNQKNQIFQLKHTNDAKKLWKSFSEENKEIKLQEEDKTTNLKFSLHDHNFDLLMKINFKNVLSTEQKVASWLVMVLPAAILLIILISIFFSVINNNANAGNKLVSFALPIFILIFGGGLTAGYFITKKPKKTISNFDEIDSNIKTTLQKLTLIRRDGIFDKTYLGFDSEDGFMEIKSKINHEWILENKNDFLSNHQGITEKNHIVGIEVNQTDDSNNILVGFRIKERRLWTLKESSELMILEKNQDPIKFEFLIALN